MRSSSTFIIAKIAVSPGQLNKDIETHIQHKIEQFYNNRCSEKYGYITNILKIVQIIDAKISPSTPMVFVTVKIEVECLKPNINQEYDSTVCMVFNRGVFLEVQNKLKILVPIDKIKDYDLNEDNTKLVSNTKEINKGDIVKVKIYDYKYSSGCFHCLGTLM